MSEPSNILVIAATIAGAGLALIALVIWRKCRPFMSEGHVFRASRLSAGNRLFPTQVAITPTSVVHYTPQWIGKFEHSIHMAHIASVQIDTHLLFSDVYIETTGGATPVRCHGHRKSDAIEIKELIERYQSDYFRRAGAGTGAPPGGGS
ncbi:MAG: PH domain-containing protein [Acidobacteria bacterium]|nr:PH domain-containing protein [Acidobacteriota bacterium]